MRTKMNQKAFKAIQLKRQPVLVSAVQWKIIVERIKKKHWQLASILQAFLLFSDLNISICKGHFNNSLSSFH